MQLLRRSQSALVLMDMSTELPDLKRTKGLNNWLVKQGCAAASLTAASLWLCCWLLLCFGTQH